MPTVADVSLVRSGVSYLAKPGRFIIGSLAVAIVSESVVCPPIE
ncbi:MAG TPA: hypothetical protein VHR17_02465 [Thermoanaerobaculia bacterium]|nr:hypothetical protein [Thermoanaerobaculia bacterium]